MASTAKKLHEGDPDFKSEAYPPSAELPIPTVWTLTSANDMKGPMSTWFHTGDCEVSDPVTGEHLGAIMPGLGGVISVNDSTRGETWSIGPDVLWYLYQHYRAQLDEAYVERMKKDDTARQKWQDAKDKKSEARDKRRRAKEKKAEAARRKRERAAEKRLKAEQKKRAAQKAAEEPPQRPLGSTHAALDPALNALQEANRRAAASLGIDVGPSTGSLIDRYLRDPDGTMADMTKAASQHIHGDADELYAEDFNGWLSPEGKFHSCPYGNHISKAHELVTEALLEAHEHNAERALELTGWAKLTKGDWAWEKLPTGAQRNYILSWFMDHDRNPKVELDAQQQEDLED
jgi:hypothetical protein